MNAPSSRLRRSLRLASIVTATASLVVVACGGSSSSNDTTKTPPTDGGATTSSNGSSSGGSSSGGSSSSSGASNGGSTGTDASASDDATVAPSKSDDAGVQLDAAACSATASEVVLIGDSYFALSGEIQAQLEVLATAGGALASGDEYRHYYRSGANLYPGYTDSIITPIPTQFTQAVTANPDIKYVIMDGGGNDILLENPTCIDSSDAATVMSTECVTAVQNAVDAATTLFQSMKAAGVEKVIYFFYPHLPTTGQPDVNVMLDYGYPLVEQACANAAIPCYLIDTRPAFANHPEYIGGDNIHPTTAGSDVIAGLIWNDMLQECVAL